MTLRSTEPLTEMSSSVGKGRATRKADNQTVICNTMCLEIMRASTPHNPIDFHGL
jgi:hypothetical protein